MTLLIEFFYHGQEPPVGQGLLIIEDSWPHSFRHTTLGKTPLYEWSVSRRDLYLTTNNTHNRQTSMPPAGFEPTIPASERPTQSIGLLWTSDQLVAETSTWRHTTLATDKYPCPRWDSNPQFQQVSGRWDPLLVWVSLLFIEFVFIISSLVILYYFFFGYSLLFLLWLFFIISSLVILYSNDHMSGDIFFTVMITCLVIYIFLIVLCRY